MLPISHFIFSLKLCRRLCNQSRIFSMYVGIKNMDNTGKFRVVDLRSDTFTKPSMLMRKAIFEAEVGDDDYGEDPTVIALEKKAAEMLGKESALFVASGTMSNLIAIMTHCKQRGAEMITGDRNHTFLYEQGGAAQLGGIHTLTLPTLNDGTYDIAEMEKRVRLDDPHYPITSLICIENTHNMCGGKVLPLDWLDKLGERANHLGIPVHMDGARLFNAAVHLGLPASRLVRDCSSASVCLSKGLGAPVGSVLVGEADFIRRARRTRKVMGGGMRQSGILAAAGLYSLNNMVERLSEDHARTAAIAQAIAEMRSPVMWVDRDPAHTNILMVHLNPEKLSAEQLAERMARVTDHEAAKLGEKAVVVKVNPLSPGKARLVVHCDITDDDVDAVTRKLRWINSECCK